MKRKQAQITGGEPANSARPAVELAPDGPLDLAVSGLLWAAGLSWLAPMMAAQMALYRVFEPRQLQWLERLYTRGQIALTGSRWRSVVHPSIAADRAYIFFQNHVNHLDHCALYHATPHFKQGIELEEHFRYPIYGHYMKARGTIPVRRGDFAQLRLLVQRMRAELERGASLLVFPEGTRTQTGHLGALQPGMFRVAQQLGAPIVPVTVTGMYRVMRKGSNLIRPGHTVTVYCDEPIETAGMTRKDVPALITAVRDVMQARLDAYYSGHSR